MPARPWKDRALSNGYSLASFILSLTRQGSAEGLTRGWDRLPADLRDAGTDGPPPGSCRFAGDFGWRHVSDGTQVSAAARTWMAAARGFTQLHVSRMASASFRVIRPVLLEVLRTS